LGILFRNAPELIDFGQKDGKVIVFENTSGRQNRPGGASDNSRSRRFRHKVL